MIPLWVNILLAVVATVLFSGTIGMRIGMGERAWTRTTLLILVAVVLSWGFTVYKAVNL